METVLSFFSMRRRLLFLLSLFGSLALVQGSAFAAFPDVPVTHPSADAIDFVQSRGIVQGYPDGTFQPDRTINRAEFLKIIILASADPTVAVAPCSNPSLSKLRDVPAGAWYVQNLCIGLSLRIIDGYPDLTFRGNQPINFAEAAKIIVQAFGFETGKSDLWYEPYGDALAARYAIPLSITGYDQLVTRGEMAEMIYRLRNVVTIQSIPLLPASSPSLSSSSSPKPESQPDLGYCADVSVFDELLPWFQMLEEQLMGPRYEYEDGHSTVCHFEREQKAVAFLSFGQLVKHLDITKASGHRVEVPQDFAFSSIVGRSGSILQLQGVYYNGNSINTVTSEYDLDQGLVRNVRAVPQYVDVCTEPRHTGDDGWVGYPSKYSHSLSILGELLTALDCGEMRFQEVAGTLNFAECGGGKVTIVTRGAPSSDFRDVLSQIGFIVDPDFVPLYDSGGILPEYAGDTEMLLPLSADPSKSRSQLRTLSSLKPFADGLRNAFIFDNCPRPPVKG